MPVPERFKTAAINAGLFLVALIVALVIAEVLVRSFFFNPYYQCSRKTALQDRGEDLVVELDPDYLYKFKPDRRLGINRDGFRDRDFTADKKGKKRILFLGDSFVEGVNVDAGASMPKVLERRLGKGVEVFNMGVVGYGPDQALKVFQKFAPRLKPDMVIQGIFPGNDYGDLVKNRLFDVIAQGDVRETARNPVLDSVFPSLSFIVNEFNYAVNREKIFRGLDNLLFGDLYNYAMMADMNSSVARAEFLLMRGVLRKTKQVMDSRKVPYLAVIIPGIESICDHAPFIARRIPPEKYFFNEQMTRMICEAEKIPYVDLTPYFLKAADRCSLYDLKDRHLSELGYAYAAEIIFRQLPSSLHQKP